MKPSASSSSLAFFKSQTSASAGCILDVLRRILCSRTLPSVHTSDTCSCSAAKHDKAINQAVPGLVARLMGLDSIPDRMITKSRSLKSAEHFKPQNGDDQHRKLQHLHRRSKTPQRFPTYVELDDNDFIVLKFDNRKKSPRTNQKREKTAASPEIESSDHREADSRIKKHFRLIQKMTQSSSSNTEESSPASIFYFQEPASADDDSWTRSSSSSSRVTSPEQDNTNISTKLGSEETIEARHKAALLNNTVVHVNGRKKKKREMWGRVCDITVAEIKGAEHTETYWCLKEDLAAEFEVHIMDQLLNDLLLHLNKNVEHHPHLKTRESTQYTEEEKNMYCNDSFPPI